MGFLTRHIRRAGLIGLVSLIALSLTLPHPYAARALAAACLDGFALWARSATRSDTILLSGSTLTIGGAVRSNAAIKVSGSNSSITGPVTYATSFEDGGDDNSYPAPNQAAPTLAQPFAYTSADYAPGGSVAQAIPPALYKVVDGDLDVSEPTTLSGLYYVRGNAKLGASEIRGTFTIVAEGMIDVSGSSIVATPYANGLLLFANKNEPGGAVLKLAGSNNSLGGIIYAPRGMVEISSSNSTIEGSVLGDTLLISGSSLRMNFAPAYCPGDWPPADDGQYIAGEVIVKLRSANDLAAVAADYGLNPQPIDQFGSRPIYQLAIIGDISPVVKAAQLTAGDSRVEYAEPNYIAQDPESRRGRGSWVVGASAGGYATQWAPTTIRLPQAHTISRGDDVTVAVLDTGIDLGHPAFASRLVPGFDFVDFDASPQEEGVPPPAPGEPEPGDRDAGFGHGTHVAGLVLLAAPEASVMPVRVLDPDGKGNIWVLSEGLIFAAELGPDGVPASGDEADVINLSLGTLRPTRLLEDLVAEVTCAAENDDDDDDDDDEDDDDNTNNASPICASGRGVIVIAASGNDGNTTPQYPAAEAVAGSLAIGASTRADTRAGFSTYGSWVRIAAPGEEIISTVPGGTYGTWSGTSMAAPLAAGVAALVRAIEPDLSPQAVTDRLVRTAQPIVGTIPVRLDAAAAVGFPPSVPTDTANAIYLPMITRFAAD